jgi:hypothetical protein
MGQSPVNADQFNDMVGLCLIKRFITQQAMDREKKLSAMKRNWSEYASSQCCDCYWCVFSLPGTQAPAEEAVSFMNNVWIII